MVLSNKKLKQKLKAIVAEALAKSEAGEDPNGNGPTEQDPKVQPQVSLKQLLNSATQRPRLSKREKRRNSLPLQGLKESEGNEGGGSEGLGEEKKKKKKRKREEENEEGKDGDLGPEGNGVVNEAKKLKSKKNKKKKTKRKKKGKHEKEESNGGELEIEQQEVAETNRYSDSQAFEEVSAKVYAGGIPYYSTEDDIRSYFEHCGTITEVDCMTFPETGKFRGIAIISFKTEAAAKRALALDGGDMGGFYLRIQPYKANRSNKAPDFAPGRVEGYNRIYVGNLSWDITEDDLKKLFSDCNISSIRFGMNKETGEFRGYAHVDFSDSLSLTMALKLDQQIVCGRPVKISYAVPSKGAVSHSKSEPTSQVSEAAEAVVTAGTSASSGKMRRRTCYECGEKGHISSDCPKKQNADQANSGAS